MFFVVLIEVGTMMKTLLSLAGSHLLKHPNANPKKEAERNRLHTSMYKTLSSFLSTHELKTENMSAKPLFSIFSIIALL